jgi:hypothetical protein
MGLSCLVDGCGREAVWSNYCSIHKPGSDNGEELKYYPGDRDPELAPSVPSIPSDTQMQPPPRDAPEDEEQ